MNKAKALSSRMDQHILRKIATNTIETGMLIFLSEHFKCHFKHSKTLSKQNKNKITINK